jgi:hypothetical protein
MLRFLYFLNKIERKKQGIEFIYIFVALKKVVTLTILKGMTGFDSGQKWYVSMQCVGDLHLNLSYQNFIWRK